MKQKKIIQCLRRRIFSNERLRIVAHNRCYAQTFSLHQKKNQNRKKEFRKVLQNENHLVNFKLRYTNHKLKSGYQKNSIKKII